LFNDSSSDVYIVQLRLDGMIMNGGFGRMLKDVAVVYLKVV
jgi:hypothetical protein